MIETMGAQLPRSYYDKRNTAGCCCLHGAIITSASADKAPLIKQWIVSSSPSCWAAGAGRGEKKAAWPPPGRWRRKKKCAHLMPFLVRTTTLLTCM